MIGFIIMGVIAVAAVAAVVTVKKTDKGYRKVSTYERDP